MAVTTLAIVALAFSLDLLIGEPPTVLHPVAWFDRFVEVGDETRGDERSDRVVGVAIALVLPLVPAAVAAGAVVLATAASPFAGGFVAAIVLFFATSLRRPLELLEDVLEALEEADPDRARERIRAVAGRDVPTRSPGRLRSAALESATTLLSDGLLATLLPFALLAPLSLPVAAAVAAWIGAVTALDSAFDFPERPAATANARLAIAVTWLPARITAACIAVAAVDPGALLRATEWTRTSRSPNAGWPTATLAAALDVRLEISDGCVRNPAAPLPTAEAGERALTVVGLAAALGVLVAALLAAVGSALAGPEPIVLTAGWTF